MPPELINILIQIPIVAVFIWYFDRLLKVFIGFLQEQRETDRNVLSDLLKEIRELRKDYEHHDQKVTEAIGVMKDRTTRPRQ